MRPIHYLGSKLRLRGWIADIIDQVAPPQGRVCDLFAGSGTLSAELIRRRPVTAVDIQEYSRTLCSALLNPATDVTSHLPALLSALDQSSNEAGLGWAVAPLVELENSLLERAESGEAECLPKLLDASPILAHQLGMSAPKDWKVNRTFQEVTRRLSEIGLNRGPSSVVTRHFGGVFFSYEQSIAFDALLNATTQLGRSRDTVVAAIAAAASDCANTVGKQFAQPIRLLAKDGSTKIALIPKILKDRKSAVRDRFLLRLGEFTSLPEPSQPGAAERADFDDYLRRSIEPLTVVYADPPYTRDHYSRYYHVLETMCLRDEPTVSLSNLGGGKVISRGVYRVDRHQSPFCIRSQAPGAFSRLFAEVRRRHIPLVLSYSPYGGGTGRAHPRVMTIEQLTALAKTMFSSVEQQTAGTFAHSKLNSSALTLEASDEAEMALICRP